jgi:hypothetical protein
MMSPSFFFLQVWKVVVVVLDCQELAKDYQKVCHSVVYAYNIQQC